MKFIFFKEIKCYLIGVLAFVDVCWAQPNTANLDKIFYQQGLDPAIIGISVKDVASRKIVYEKNSHYQLTPASTFKLVVTMYALKKLGSDYRFKTSIYYSGEINNKTLYGDLIIKGYGDPTIESRFFKYSALQDICHLLKKSGIEKINGKLILDNSYFKAELNDNWVWEDINNYYTAIPYPINVYDNEYHIYLQSQKENEPVQVLRIYPQYTSKPVLEVIDNSLIAKAGGDNAFIYGDPFGYIKRLKGSIPPYQANYSIEGALPDPPRMFAQELIKHLRESNIHLVNPTMVIVNEDTLKYTNMKLLENIFSPPLSEIIRLTNLHSINLFAEAMMWAIGNGNYENGKKEIVHYLKQMQFNHEELNIDDACGLSRLDGISADLLSSLLVEMYTSKYKDVFLNSLPVCGETGTMKNFCTTLPLKSNLQCKTGYIQRVRTYAGYMTTKSGKKLSICLMYNNFGVSSEKIKQVSKIFFETLYENF